jgi:hypothetical protein
MLAVVLVPPAWTAALAATGLAYLKNGVDARSTILGEAVVSHVADASACYWNPAGLGALERPQLLLSHVESFADLRHEYGAAVQPLGRVAAGLFFNGMWTDDIQGYDAQANRTGAFGFATYEVGVAVGAPLGTGLRVGGALKYLNESIDTYSASGWAADLGVQYEAGAPLGMGTGVDDPSLLLGAVVKHLGGSVSFIEEPVDLPLTVQGGVSSAIPLPRLSGRLVLALEGRHVRDDGSSLLLGGEYEYRRLLRFGAGYQTGRDTRDVSLGLGLRQGPLAFHWSFVPIKDDLGDEHRLTLGLDL